MSLKYKRILLKVSGEALMGDKAFGIANEPLEHIANEIKQVHDLGVEIAVVVGGGNIFRGMNKSSKFGMDRATGDYVGMLATVMNGITLQSAIKSTGLDCRVLSAVQIPQVAETFIRQRAISYLKKGKVVIFVGGTGNPYFTTDTASALRASEISADAMYMAKNGVDGVYSDDPKTNPDAKKIDSMTYDDIIKNDLKVMDISACTLCRQNNIPIVVFDFKAKGGIIKILNSEKVGTYIGE